MKKHDALFFENSKISPSNITEVWLCRKEFQDALRICNVDEKYVTGCGSDFEKFRELCRVMPSLAGNRVYIDAHRELLEFFGCPLSLKSENCKDIWTLTADLLLLDKVSRTEVSRPIPTKATQGPKDIKMIFEKTEHTPKSPILVFDFTDTKKFINSLLCEHNLSFSNLAELCSQLLLLFDVTDVKTYAYHKLCEDFEFTKPNEYAADIILKKILSDIDITKYESSLLTAQLIRYLGREYVGKKIKIFIEIRNCKKDVLSLLDYLASCDALPHVSLVSDQSAEYIEKILIPATTAHRNIRTSVISGADYTKALKTVSEKASLGSFLGISPIATADERLLFSNSLADFLADLSNNCEYLDEKECIHTLAENIFSKNTVEFLES